MSLFKVEKGKRGFLTLKYQEKFIHSTVDPIAEAEKLVPENSNTKLFIIFGLGLGYLPQAILKKYPDENIKVVVFEIHNEIIALFEENKTWEDNRFFLFHNNNFHLFTDFFAAYFPPEEVIQPVFLELKTETMLFPEPYQELKKKVEEFFRFYFQTLFTGAEFSPLWYKNIIQNTKKIIENNFTLYLENDCVLVSAGPTLSQNIALLKHLKQKMPIIAVDTALKPLLESSIEPDMIIAADPQIHNYKDFFHLKELKNKILAADIAVYPKIPQMFEKIFFFRTEGIAETLFQILQVNFNLSIPLFPGGGSVSSSALMLLSHIGAKRIFLVGQDLVYPHITHAKATIHYDRFLFASHKKNPLWNGFHNIIKKRGKQDLFLGNLKTWIEQFIELKEIEIVHISPLVSLKGASYDISEPLKGKIHIFPKISVKTNHLLDVWDPLLDVLFSLRETRKAQDFFHIRNQSVFSNIFNELFIKQDLYFKRHSGDEVLFLGGCFRIIDRLLRAIALHKKGVYYGE